MNCTTHNFKFRSVTVEVYSSPCRNSASTIEDISEMALQNALGQIVTSLRHDSQNQQITENGRDFKSSLLADLLHPNFTAIVKLYDSITTGSSPEGDIKNIQVTFQEVQQELCEHTGEDETELLNILKQPEVTGLFDCMHNIAVKNFDPIYEPQNDIFEEQTCDNRIVEFEFEKPFSPLGFTLKMESGQVKVARIIQHGFVAKHGYLTAGDVILQVNDQKIDGHFTVADVQALLQQASGKLKLKILPSNKPNRLPLENYFVQANFNYSASNDKMLPAKSVGLSFKKGAILQILSQEDQFWWQAKLVSRQGTSDYCGLIPSLVFEERRRAKNYKKRTRSSDNIEITCKCYPSKMKSMKHSYSTVSTEISNTLDQYEMHLYEEVAQVPSFERKSIIIIATPCSLRRFLVSLIVSKDPENYLKPLEYTNHTSVISTATNKLAYTATEQLISEIHNQDFLTVSKQENIYSCIKEESIKEIIASDKICVLEVEEHDIKLIKRVIFAPLVVLARTQHLSVLREHNNTQQKKVQPLSTHIKESDRILYQYGHLIDVVVNISPTRIVENILEAKDKFSNGPQWVPASWVY